MDPSGSKHQPWPTFNPFINTSLPASAKVMLPACFSLLWDWGGSYLSPQTPSFTYSMGEGEHLHPLGFLEVGRWCFYQDLDSRFALHDLLMLTGGSNSQTEECGTSFWPIW